MGTQPTGTVFETREDLGLRFEEFDLAMNASGFIGHRIMPILPRGRMNGKFPRVAIDQLVQNLNTQRNPDGTYNRSTRSWDNDNYETAEYGLEAPLDDRTQARYDDLIDAEQFEGEVIEHSLLLDYEQAVAANMFNATTFTGRTAAVTNEWDDLTNATPVTDVNAAINVVRLACGVKPNALIINDVVLRNLARSDQIIANLKNQNFVDVRPGSITKQVLALALNIDEIIVADGLYNTNQPGVDASLADIWSNEFALVARVAQTRNPMERCVGRSFMWDREGAMSGDGMGVISETYYEENRRGGVLRKRTDWGLKNLFLQCGYLYSNITT